MTETSAINANASNALLNRLYISQMLRFSGAFTERGSFGGGAGESQFVSFLREEYAARLGESLRLLPEPIAKK